MYIWRPGSCQVQCKELEERGFPSGFLFLYPQKHRSFPGTSRHRPKSIWCPPTKMERWDLESWLFLLLLTSVTIDWEVQGRKFWCSYLLLPLSQIKFTATPCYRKYKSRRYKSWLISVFQGFCTHGCFHSCRSSYRRTLRCAQHLQFSKAGKNFIFVKTKWGVAHFLAKGLFYSKTLLSADLHL